jgi:hypothetical protein
MPSSAVRGLWAVPILILLLAPGAAPAHAI